MSGESEWYHGSMPFVSGNGDEGLFYLILGGKKDGSTL